MSTIEMSTLRLSSNVNGVTRVEFQETDILYIRNCLKDMNSDPVIPITM